MRTEPPEIGGIARRSRVAARAILALHTTTRTDVVRRLVIQEERRPCDELRRAESERILRAQPFLAEASISTFDDGQGGVVLEVVTVDEISTLLDIGPTMQSPYVNRLRVGTANLGGFAMLAMGEWRAASGPYRDTYGMRVIDYQFLGRPYELSFVGARRPLGSDWTTLASHAFLTDLQRVAWRAATGARNEYVPLLRPNADPPSVRLSRSFTDIGGIVRIGEPGRLSLFGASFTREHEDAGDEYVIITRDGLFHDDTTVFRKPYRPYKSARANALWGVRNIHFLRVTGFDALTATQDVRVGFQLGTLAGRSLAVLGSGNDDIFVSADVYGGLGTPQNFVAVQVQGEGRQSYDDNAWDGILGSGRLASYNRLTARHTLVSAAEWSGGWRQRVPFQVTLADVDGGVRGYRRSQIGGGRRLVGRFEDRWYIGRIRAAADVGLATFLDAGRLWAGDAPFGVDTRWKYGAGFGLLVAVPPRSKRLYRVDIAYPLSPDPHARLEIKLTTSDLTRQFWREPGDVRRSRESTVPASIFNWP